MGGVERQGLKNEVEKMRKSKGKRKNQGRKGKGKMWQAMKETGDRKKKEKEMMDKN